MESVVHTVGVWSCFFYIDYMHHLAIPLSTAQKRTPSPRPYVNRPLNLRQARAQMTITYPCTTDVMLRVWL